MFLIGREYNVSTPKKKKAPTSVGTYLINHHPGYILEFEGNATQQLAKHLRVRC